EGLPFEPIAAALRSAVRALGRERLAELAGPSLPDLARLLPELAGSRDQVPLALTQTEWLQVRTFEGVLIVVSVRTDELHRRHPLVGWLAEVERLPRVERVDLARFDRAELGELLVGILGTRPTAALVDTIAARSDGNA